MKAIIRSCNGCPPPRVGVWTSIAINGDSIKASCGNDPVNIDGLKLRDVRTFKVSEISDWVILSDKKCYGGYTVRVMAKMDPKNAPPFEFADFESGVLGELCFTRLKLW